MKVRGGNKHGERAALAILGMTGLLLAADLFGKGVLPGAEAAGREAVKEVVSQERKGMEEGISLKTAGPKEEGTKAEASKEESIKTQKQRDETRKEEKSIALTFDDGPHPVYTPKLLKGLKERGVHVTFFLIGQNIDGNEELIRQMKEDGHLIGNHSQNHLQLTKKQTKEACDQITQTNEKIKSITGETPLYVRPPFGSWSEELECIVPMKVVLWNVDPLDWKTQNKAQIVRHIVSHAEDGSIILLHDVYETSVDAALEVIDTLSAEGYNFVTVDELLID